jgi:hypothetical protein
MANAKASFNLESGPTVPIPRANLALKGGEIDGKRVLPREALQSMTTPHAEPSIIAMARAGPGPPVS